MDKATYDAMKIRFGRAKEIVEQIDALNAFLQDAKHPRAKGLIDLMALERIALLEKEFAAL